MIFSLNTKLPRGTCLHKVEVSDGVYNENYILEIDYLNETNMISPRE